MTNQQSQVLLINITNGQSKHNRDTSYLVLRARNKRARAQEGDSSLCVSWHVIGQQGERGEQTNSLTPFGLCGEPLECVEHVRVSSTEQYDRY